MNIEQGGMPTENTPRPFLEIPKLWLQFTKMSEDFFRQEIVHTSTKNTLLGVLIYTGVATALSVLLSILRIAFNSPTQPPSLITNILTSFILLSCVGIVLFPVSFYLGVAINFLSALILGGKGTFSAQAYLESLFLVPLGLITAVFSFVTLIPSVGDYVLYILIFGISIFHLVLVVRTVKVVHSFTTTRAIVAVLAPILLLLIPLCMLGTLMVMGPLLNNLFSAISTSLPTPIP